MNWILVVVLAIIALMGFVGFKKGLIKMVFSLVSTIAALLIAVIFSPVVSGIMKNSENVVGFIDEKVTSIVNFSSEEAAEAGESEQEDLISSLPLPESIKQSLLENNTAENYVSLKVDEFEEYVCRQITNVIINAIAFVITLIIAIVALWFVCNALNLLAKLPLLRQLNATAGLAAGLAEGILIVWILFVVLTMFAGSEFGRDAMEMIAENPLLDFLYKNNLVSKFITRG
ncbi:MAG: CvpA family protein [Lachnospiraceae bacterium]|nr:CvpA family protein [Lachnospiraceae bacterium]